ncbi:MAG: hypothetical protein J5772_06175 [Clostridia bacterium]|nr:hypothetical protein [Clostridia bacterium]
MRDIKKTLILILAVLLMLTVCTAVFAEDGSDGSDNGEIVTVGATQPDTSNLTVGFIVLDENGEPMKSSTAMSCLGGSGAELFVKHAYTIVAKYYDSDGKEVETDEQLILSVDTDSECVTLDKNTIKLAPSDDPYAFTIRYVDHTKDAGEASGQISVNRVKFSLIDLIIGFLGIYLIYSAIRNNGAFFNTEFIKEEKKADYKRTMLPIAIVTGLLLIAASVIVIYFSCYDWSKVVRLVLLGAAVLGLIAMAFVNGRMTDKEKRAKAQAAGGMNVPTASNAAFEFDDDEPTLDDVLADLNNKENADPGSEGEN